MNRRLRAYAPLLVASAAILVVLVIWLSRSDGSSAARPAAPAPPVAPAASRATPVPDLQPASRPPLVDGGVQVADADPDGHDAAAVPNTTVTTGDPKMDPGPDHAPPPPLSLDEKLDLARKHVTVMHQHVDQLKAEIAAGERAGDTVQVTEKRVRLKRLEAQIVRTQRQIDARIDPSRPEAEQQTGDAPRP